MYNKGYMAQRDNQKLVSQRFHGSTQCSSCFSLVFIKNLINDKLKHKNKMLLFVLYFQCTSQLFNMYKSNYSRNNNNNNIYLFNK